MAVHKHMIESGRNAFLESITELRQPARLLCHLVLTQGACFAETDNTRDRQSAAAQTPLVTAAVQDWLEPHTGIPAAHVQCPDSLGPVDFVSRQAKQIDPHFLHIERNLAYCLDGIRVEEDVALLAKLADFLDRLNG